MVVYKIEYKYGEYSLLTSKAVNVKLVRNGVWLILKRMSRERESKGEIVVLAIG